MKYPEFKYLDKESNKVKVVFTVSPELDWFKGHFNGMPVLPAVAVIAFMVHAAADNFESKSLSAVPQAKFMRIIKAGTVIKGDLSWDSERCLLSFTLSENADPEIIYAAGKLKF